MRVSAVICEYNPFHNGHKYQLEQIKKELHSDYIIAIMSGNFVQRGAPAIIDKYARAEAALDYADLVLELPVLYATSSAEGFAEGAIRILDGLSFVDDLVFGAEDDDMEAFVKVSEVLCDEPASYKELLQEALKLGQSFPAARSNALSAYLGTDAYQDLLEKPNNVLGIEYIKALKKLGSSIKPHIIKRKGHGYHDLDAGAYASASAIRKQILQDEHVFADSVPSSMNSYISMQYKHSFPVVCDDFSDLLFYRLMTECAPETILDYHPEIWDRIRKYKDQATTFDELVALTKTKNFTYTRISRFLIHMMLGIKTSDYALQASYARILGFNKASSVLLKLMKEQAKLPVIQKPSRYEDLLDEHQKRLYELDLSSSKLYYNVIRRKYKNALEDDLSRALLIR